MRAFAGDDDDQKVEKRVVVRHAGGGRLGVTIGDTTGDARGAAVRSVAEGSAAAKAGIKEGDVIVRFDGETVRGASQLSRLVAETPAGRAVAIEVTRGGATQKLTATLAEGGHGIRVFRGEGPQAVHEFDFDMPVGMSVLRRIPPRLPTRRCRPEHPTPRWRGASRATTGATSPSRC